MKKYGLIGNPLGHSFSPQIHALLGDYEYKLYPMEKESVAPFLASKTLDALNVTIPYKEVVIPCLDRISDEAKRIGSVNTVVKESDGSLSGYNTDHYGFTAMLKYYGIDPNGKKAIILGSGGSSKTAVAALSDMGATETVVVSRSGENNYENLYLHKDAEIIINTTPLGMYPKNGVAAVDLRDFPNCKGVADLVYNPKRTALLLQAEELGIPCAYGLCMLVAQAIRAAEYFFNRTYPRDTLTSVLSEISSKMRNITLIGMPGCGKSTVGRLIAERTCKKFIDSDDEITRKTGKTPAEWITEQGEAEFRRIETEVLTELSRESGIVLATGGGAVTVQKNKSLLRQNGSVFFINRSVELLCSDGRPLSGALTVRQELFKKRHPLYTDFADVMIQSDQSSTPQDTAEKIIAAFKEISARG